MTLNVDDNGTIFLHQGDSGEITIYGLPDDEDYKIYFAVRDKDRNPVGNEMVVNSNYQRYVTFHLTSEFTNLLTVDKNEHFEVYYYGLKKCTNDTEDTLYVRNKVFGELNTMIVFPKIVEGSDE